MTLSLVSEAKTWTRFADKEAKNLLCQLLLIEMETVLKLFLKMLTKMSQLFLMLQLIRKRLLKQKLSFLPKRKPKLLKLKGLTLELKERRYSKIFSNLLVSKRKLTILKLNAIILRI